MTRKFYIIVLTFITLFACNTNKQTLTSKFMFYGSEKEIIKGQDYKISWSVPPEYTVKISDIDSVLNNRGSVIVKPDISKQYILTVTDKKGKTYTKNISVVVHEPVLINMRLERTTISSWSDSTKLFYEIHNLKEKDYVSLKYSYRENYNSWNYHDKFITLKDSIGFIYVDLEWAAEYNYALDKRTFTIQVERNQKIIASNNVELFEAKKYDYSRGPDDGRFTMGGNGVRLMYGYPVPRSTSHFVVSVDGKYAINTPYFKNIQYLSGYNEYKGDSCSLQVSTELYFNGVKITQNLIPVDRNFAPVPINSYGQLYKIEYVFENMTKETKKVGLVCLIDLMIADNDAATNVINGKFVTTETGYLNDKVPDEVQSFYNYPNQKEGTCWTVMNKGEAVKPDEYYIGRWGYLFKVTYDVVPNGQTYGDSGELLKWKAEDLAAGDKRSVCFYFGFPYDSDIEIVMNQKIEERYINVYYKEGEYKLSTDDESKIKKVINEFKSQIIGIEIAAYSDATGSEQVNLQLSKKRAENISKYIQSLGIKKNIIIPKFYGEQYANQSNDAQETGSEKDRRAVISIFLKTKK